MAADAIGGMGAGVPLVEVWRGPFLECVHRGHAAVAGPDGELIEAWGDPALTVLPRSACKMIQALPLAERGVEDAPGRLALACASHEGAAIHTSRAADWLAAVGAEEGDYRCGPQMPADEAARTALIREGRAPGQIHNNCSGKHAGFLALARHMGAGPDYVDPTHPVQRAVRAAFEDVTGETSPGYAVDGCSAPNFACTLAGLARAMAAFAAADGAGARSAAMVRLREAMVLHPELVAGEGRACTELMRAMRGAGRPVAVKTGAEGVFVAILSGPRPLGVALKIEDGATRASECAIAAILARLGALDPASPAARARMDAPILNRRGIVTGAVRPAAALRP